MEVSLENLYVDLLGLKGLSCLILTVFPLSLVTVPEVFAIVN